MVWPKYWVKYTVFGKIKRAGPYFSLKTAGYHQVDIAGFDGILGCHIYTEHLCTSPDALEGGKV